MCGIAGLIHRGKTGDVGREMTAMLQSLKHRGPDSTGYALYGKPHGKELVIRFKVAEQDEMSKGFEIHRQVKERRSEIERRLAELDAKILEEDIATEYAFRFRITYEGDLRRLANYIEDVEGAEILSIGHGLELIKDLGDAARVSGQYSLSGFVGTHAIGRPIRTGHIPLRMSRSCTTASSPTTGTVAGHWSGAVTASCRIAIRK
jgi:glutamate synthase domain-containing protein 1